MTGNPRNAMVCTTPYLQNEFDDPDFFFCLITSFFDFFYFTFQTNTSALSDMIDPSDRKVSEFPTVGIKSNTHF